MSPAQQELLDNPRLLGCPICGLEARVVDQYYDSVHQREMVMVKCMTTVKDGRMISSTQHYLGMPEIEVSRWPTPI